MITQKLNTNTQTKKAHLFRREKVKEFLIKFEKQFFERMELSKAL